MGTIIGKNGLRASLAASMSLCLLLSACNFYVRERPYPAYAVIDNNVTAGAEANATDEIALFQGGADVLKARIHDLATQLMNNMNGVADLEGPIAVTTFVDLNHLYRTSPLGRYLAEGLMGELQRAGLLVTEIRKADSILIKERLGEYSLSRNIKEISKHSSAQYLLVGTYVTRGDYVLVNTRIISNKDNVLVSSAVASFTRDHFLDRMLWPSSAPMLQPGVTIPVKGLGEETNVRIIPGS